jgi:protein-S-isoprenylcysteine O-methyltransferase Ste14
MTPRAHGFYRFFAWEAILALVLVNFRGLRQWFHDPFSARQLVSWCLLIGSLVPGLWGIQVLRTLGSPEFGRRDDTSLFGIERTTRLVTSGPFRYIRHPLYGSLLLLTWGVFFKRPSLLSGGLALTATALLGATAKVEEVENVRYFGAAYRAYMEHTRMFIPFLL